MGIMDFFSQEAGQKRRAALDEFGRDIGYYVPPELRGLLGFIAEATPTASLERAAQASQRMVAPNRTPMQRVGDLGAMLSETAGVVAPAIVANRAAMPAAQALQESLLGFSMAGKGADDAARRFVADESGNIKLWHGSPYDFDKFDLQKIGTGEGAQDLGRGFSLTDYEANAHMYTNPASRWGDLDAMERYSKAGPGRYYQVDVNADPSQFLDWNKPWRDQVKEGTPLFDALKKREDVYLKNYADDPDMIAAIPQAKLSSMWKDGAGMENAAMQSGFVGNKRGNYSGDTEYTVFDPSKMNIVKKFDKDGNELPISQQPQGITAYHGSPHDFDRFSMDAIGTGEGAQAYGHGLYFAQNENVARGYRDQLSRPYYATEDGANIAEKYGADVADIFERSGGDPQDIRDAITRIRSIVQQNLDDFGATDVSQLKPQFYGDLASATIEFSNRADKLEELINSGDVKWFDPGRMYEVNINANPDDFLDWDKPLSEQPQAVKDALGQRIDALKSAGATFSEDPSGDQLWRAMHPQGGIDKIDFTVAPAAQASRTAREAGIPGIKYLDAGSRGAGEGSRNFVVFDENLISIVRKYGIAGAAAMLGVSASDIQSAIDGKNGLLSDQEQNKQEIRNYLGLL